MNKVRVSCLLIFLTIVCWNVYPLLKSNRIKESNKSSYEPSYVELGAQSPRSPQWQTLRKYYLISNPRCEYCGTKEKLEVHHIKPFHLFPEDELNWGNLCTLCAKHHFEIGHKKRRCPLLVQQRPKCCDAAIVR